MPFPKRYRTLWISDVHLGTRHAKTEALLHFLQHTEADVLYLVGDIVDGWRLRRSWYWTEAANDVMQALLRKAREGTRVVYIPGNHDEFARPYAGLHFGGIAVRREAVHETADGCRLLIIPRRRVRRRRPPHAGAGTAGRRSLRGGLGDQPLAQRGAATDGTSILVAFGVS